MLSVLDALTILLCIIICCLRYHKLISTFFIQDAPSAQMPHHLFEETMNEDVSYNVQHNTNQSVADTIIFDTSIIYSSCVVSISYVYQTIFNYQCKPYRILHHLVQYLQIHEKP